MKLIFTTLLAMFALVGVAQADSAFSDALGTIDTDLDIDGTADFGALDTGFSFGAWGDPTTAGVQFDADITAAASLNVDADAVEPANFGSDQAFADVNLDAISDITGGFSLIGQTDEQGSAGSFADAFGTLNFDLDADTFGQGFADANDN